MIIDILSDLIKVPNVLLVVKNGAAVSEIRSNLLGIKQKEKWITIGDNDGPAHMHLNSELISHAEFIKEEKPERISFSVRFFDKNNERVLGAFFTKMYDENKQLRTERVKIYDALNEKYDSKIKF